MVIQPFSFNNIIWRELKAESKFLVTTILHINALKAFIHGFRTELKNVMFKILIV